MFHQVPAPNILIRLIYVAALVAGLAGSVKSPPSAFAATLTVTKTDDTDDGVCDSDCSLREAIVVANTASDVDEVILPAGTYSLTLGTLSITNPLTLTGALSSTTILSSNDAAYRHFTITDTITITIAGVTLRGGANGGGLWNEGANITLDDVIIADSSNYAGGGGIYNTGTLMLNHSRVVSNTAVIGGGIWNSAGTLIIQDSAIEANGSPPEEPYGGLGGGIISTGDVTITNSFIASNVATTGTLGGGWGGGILNYSFGHLIIDNSTLQNNEGLTGGGGVYNAGWLTFTASALLSNTVLLGAILNTENGSAFIRQSLITGNGVIGPYSGGIGLVNTSVGGAMVVEGSAIYGNLGYGVTNSGVLTMTNSTVSSNIAISTTDGYGLLSSLSGQTFLNNVTIAANQGLGISQFGDPVVIQNSVVAENLGGDCSGTLNSQGHNLIQSTIGCVITGTAMGDLYGLDSLLGPLQDNGGSTLTHALLPGSPAIDTGNPALPGSGGETCEATDQRGITRPLGAACDMGAYERDPAMPTETPTPTTTATPSPASTVTPTATATPIPPMTPTATLTSISTGTPTATPTPTQIIAMGSRLYLPLIMR